MTSFNIRNIAFRHISTNLGRATRAQKSATRAQFGATGRKSEKCIKSKIKLAVCLGSFGFVWVRLGSFGLVWARLDSFGLIWVRLGLSESGFRLILAVCPGFGAHIENLRCSKVWGSAIESAIASNTV